VTDSAIEEPYRPRTWLRGLVVVTTLVTLAVNGIAGSVGLFGRSTVDVSNRYLTLVTPAGYVFAIWGLIYVGLIAYCAAQFIRPLSTDPLPDRLAWPVIASNVFNVAWLLLWHSLNIYLTVPVMVLLLISLIVAYTTARRDRPEHPSALERWAVRAPLGLYLGWISVATIANVSNLLVAARWNGWGIPAPWWGVIVLVVGAMLAFIMLAREGDCVYAGVFVWAFAGIAAATSAAIVATIAWVLAAAIAVGIVVSAVARKRFL
jgi:benzodiazapine receptor